MHYLSFMIMENSYLDLADEGYDSLREEMHEQFESVLVSFYYLYASLVLRYS